MSSLRHLALACQNCRYYTPEGRRGGRCERLDVGVERLWKACALAIPPFATSWEKFEEEIALRHGQSFGVEALLPTPIPTVHALASSASSDHQQAESVLTKTHRSAV
jgi:hypothetical protein